MYGYDRKPPPRAGSWRETLGFVQAVFEVIAPLMGIFFVIIALLITTVALAMWHAPLALIPLAVIIAGVVHLVRRDQAKAAEDEERILGPR